MASLYHFTHFTFTTSAYRRWPAGGGGGAGVRWREEMASGGEGFGTERAKLGGHALGTELERLAQGGFRGQFYKRYPFKRIFGNTKNFTEDPIL